MSIIVKNTTFPNLFDLLAPHSCRGCGHIGSSFCECCKNYIINHHQNYCPNCKTKNTNGNCQKCKALPPIFTVSDRNSLVGDLIYDFKFSSNRSLAMPLAEIIHRILPENTTPISIVPLPTNHRHIRKRGFDHTLLLAKKLAKICGDNYSLENVLLRHKNTVQVGSNKETRLTQAENAFRLNPKITINQETTYLLLDDIWTTGASIKAALKKLRNAGASKIIIVVLAVSGLD